jgi:hypothetical protein
MNKCFNCYALNCPNRKKPSDIETNFQVIGKSFENMANFLSRVITDCDVCPVDYCKRDKSNCTKSLKGWLQSKNLKS